MTRRWWVFVSAAALAGSAYAATRSRDPVGPDGDPSTRRPRVGDAFGSPSEHPVPEEDAVPEAPAPQEAAPDDPEPAPTGTDTILVRHMEASAITVIEPPGSREEATTASTATAVPGERVAVPRSHRVSGTTLMAVAAVVSIGAIALGLWAFVSSATSDDAAPSAAVEEVVFMLAKPSTERIPVGGSVGRIVLAVDPTGHGMLVLDGLGPAAKGRSYQAWLIKPGSSAPRSAAVFQGTEMSVPLTTDVPPGATVAITLEARGGAAKPSRAPKLVAVRAA